MITVDDVETAYAVGMVKFEEHFSLISVEFQELRVFDGIQFYDFNGYSFIWMENLILVSSLVPAYTFEKFPLPRIFLVSQTKCFIRFKLVGLYSLAPSILLLIDLQNINPLIQDQAPLPWLAQNPKSNLNLQGVLEGKKFFYERVQQLNMLNIPSTVNDPKYRYRMPKMQLKIESKGNGIKTNIVNLGDIAKSLRTNAEYILKWFGTEKASQTTFKEAGGKNNTNYIINGEFSEQDLRKVLDKYIDKYVLCPKCKLPEMHMQVVGDKITGKCDSCPFVGDLDNKHRLAAFIIKKPPLAKNMATGKVIKVEAEKPAASSNPQAQKHGRKEEEQKQQRREQEQAVTFNVDNMNFGSEELNKFGDYIKSSIEALKDEDFDIKSAKIVSKIKPLGLKKPLVAFIVFNALFTVNISQQVSEHSKLYLNLMKKLVQTNTQLETLFNIQYLFLEANKDKDFTKFLPTILFNIVKEGLLSEDFLRVWNRAEIPDIEKNFFYNPNRDADFKKAVLPYLQSLDQQEEQEQETQ